MGKRDTYITQTIMSYSTTPSRLLSPFRGGGLCTPVTRIAMLAGVFIFLVGPPKSDRLKDRGQTK